MKVGPAKRNKRGTNENKPHSAREYSQISQRKRAALQRFGTRPPRRETKAREAPPLAEEVGGLRIIWRKYYREGGAQGAQGGRKGEAPVEVNYPPADKLAAR